jgi:hypothetical protein
MKFRVKTCAALPLGLLLSMSALAQSNDTGTVSPGSSAPASSPSQVHHPSRKGARKPKRTSDSGSSSPVTPDDSTGQTGRGGHGGTDTGVGSAGGGTTDGGTGTGGVMGNGAIIGGGTAGAGGTGGK